MPGDFSEFSDFLSKQLIVQRLLELLGHFQHSSNDNVAGPLSLDGATVDSDGNDADIDDPELESSWVETRWDHPELPADGISCAVARRMRVRCAELPLNCSLTRVTWVGTLVGD